MSIVKKFSGCILFVLLFLPAAALAYENSIYIWQRSWDEKIADSVGVLGPEVGHYALLCGDIRENRGRLAISRVPVNWSYLKGTSGITLCFRIHSEAAGFLDKEALPSVLRRLKGIADEMVRSAKENGVSVEEIQFDHDCPTRRLAGYVRFMESARAVMKPYKISITALPTWLKDGEFKKLIALTDSYVLQLHFFERPKTLSEARKIFDPREALTYFKQASALGRPFYVSLPTYGYEVSYDPKDGHFAGLRAENLSISWDKNLKHEKISTDPDDVLRFIRSACQLPPSHFKGFYWFRLPLQTDRFNWDILTLKKVLAGEAPKTGTGTSVKRSADGLCEVYVSNTGERDISKPVRIKVTWRAADSPLYDVLGKYEATPSENGVLLQGPAPRAGKSLLAAWFREPDPRRPLVLNIDGVVK